MAALKVENYQEVSAKRNSGQVILNDLDAES